TGTAATGPSHGRIPDIASLSGLRKKMTSIRIFFLCAIPGRATCCLILSPEGRLLGAFLQGGPRLWCPRLRLAAAPGRRARPAPPGNDDPCGDARSWRECR